MTFVEFFDVNHIENVYAYFSIVPDRVIILGNSPKKIKRAIKHYDAVFKDRDIDIKFEAKGLPSTLSYAVDVLAGILEADEEYIFDITGGSDIALTAIGIVYERYSKQGKRIQLQQYNFNSGRLQDCDGDNVVAFGMDTPPKLSVTDNIRIFGGEIIRKDSDGDCCTYEWDMNESFEKDIDKMWRICIKHPRNWNRQIDTIEEIVLCGTEDGLEYTASKSEVVNALNIEGKNFSIYNSIIKELKDARLLTRFEENGEEITVGFKNEQVMRCLTKAGQALEMKVYKAFRDKKDSKGESLFCDVMNGVQIDWDGELDENGESGDDETKNEIDVIAMHDSVPVFVSCKNGNFGADELYKLKTVSERFGGTYGKMILAATAIPARSYKTITQRAEDMGIEVVEISYSAEDASQEKSLNKELGNALAKFGID